MRGVNCLIYASCLCYAFFLSINNIGAQKYDLSKDDDMRIRRLMLDMTIDEKISLLTETAPPIERLNIEKYNHGNEALHGVVRPGNFTVFPQAIGLAATWNSELIYKIANAISDEARGRWNELDRGKKQTGLYSDLLTFWSPTVNMARDPRWGRTPETYGEDPFLSGSLGVSFVRGLQGDHPKYLKVVSTPKHFAANNEEHNRFECNAIISQKDLREYYLPAFEDCIKEGYAQSIMSAYNAINNIPCTLNKWLLTDLLRKEWGFNGYVVSDCGGPSLLVTHHKFVKTKEEAAALSLKAGLDLECGHDVYTIPLKNAYNDGIVTENEIDSAAYRVLRGRFILGLFDDPNLNPYNKISPSIVGCEEHKQLALVTARESMVLLKNKGNFLPLYKSEIKRIAVLGINATNCEFGDYSGTPVNSPVSIFQGIKNYVGDNAEVLSAPWIVLSDGYELINKEFFPNGLKAEYFSNKDLEGIPAIRTDEQINFEPANQAPDPFIPKGKISIRWSGNLQPSESGEYLIGFSTDDGCRLYIDGKCYADSWINRGVTTDTIRMNLKAGQNYKIVAEYFDTGGEALAKLKWKNVNKEKREKINLFSDALNTAKQSDVVVAVLGINKSIEREGQDRYDIGLPSDQEDFIKQLYQVNPNVVVVLVAGSSLAINWINDNIPAILNAWYPGEQGGTAVAEALFGDYSPAGRLPLTYYKSLEDLPSFDDYNVRKGRTYKYFKGKVLYPFGYGLSYTSFEYSDMKVNNTDKSLNISLTVKNTGKYNSDEVVQLYVKIPDRDNVELIKELKGFKRVNLSAGESKEVTISVDKNKLRYYDESKKEFVYPKGNYKLMLGASSQDIRLSMDINL